eukprot:5230960-Pleurochrysis_carterae.AAC.3
MHTYMLLPRRGCVPRRCCCCLPHSSSPAWRSTRSPTRATSAGSGFSKRWRRRARRESCATRTRPTSPRCALPARCPHSNTHQHLGRAAHTHASAREKGLGPTANGLGLQTCECD